MSDGRPPADRPAILAPDSAASLLGNLYASLDTRGVRWCLLREPDAGATGPGDVDLLVASGDMATFRSLVRRLHFAHIPGWGRAPHQFYLTRVADELGWLKLDVVDEIALGPHHEITTRIAAGVLRRRVTEHGVAHPSPDDRFWLLLLHVVLDKPGFTRHSAERIQRVSRGARHDSAIPRAIGSRLGHAWEPGRIVELARVRDAAGLARIAERLRHCLLDRPSARAQGLRITSQILRHLAKPLTALRYRGRAVTLLGPDGAGKSTLSEVLERDFYFQTRTVYMGLYGAASKPRLGFPVAGITSRLVMLWQNQLNGALHQVRGRLVVYDRYPYDDLLPNTARETLKSRIRRWLISHALPRPDLVIVLDVPADVLSARKDEQSIAELDEQRRRYATIAQRLPGSVLLDGNRPLDDVASDVVGLAWQCWTRGRR